MSSVVNGDPVTVTTYGDPTSPVNIFDPLYMMQLQTMDQFYHIESNE